MICKHTSTIIQFYLFFFNVSHPILHSGSVKSGRFGDNRLNNEGSGPQQYYEFGPDSS